MIVEYNVEYIDGYGMILDYDEWTKFRVAIFSMYGKDTFKHNELYMFYTKVKATQTETRIANERERSDHDRQHEAKTVMDSVENHIPRSVVS